MDHFFQIRIVGKVDDPMLEGYTTLFYLAGLTERVKLGTLVFGVSYLRPSLIEKEATTLDVLSGGRAYLGIGAAWNEREASGLRVSDAQGASRMARRNAADRTLDVVGACGHIRRTELPIAGVPLAPDKMSPSPVVELCRGLAAQGIQHAIFNMPNVHEIDPLGTFGREIIRAVAGI
jgi:hypothetical protein